jgi:hypothetical protein
MDRDPDLYRRQEFGWFLGALTLGTTVAAVLPVEWWTKLIVGVVLAFVLLPVLGWLSQPLGRVLRFLLVPVVSLPRANFAPAQAVGTVDSARASVTQNGVDSNDPAASRVIVEFAPGDLHVQYVLAPGTDPVPKMREVVDSLKVEVDSVRAMRGWQEVKRLRPPVWSRVTRAWQRAR